MVRDILISFIIQFLATFSAKDIKRYSFNNRNYLSPGDWEKLFHISSIHGVDMLLFHYLNEWDGVIPEEQRQFIKHQYSINLLRNMALSGELKRLLQTLKNEGITTLVLKGASLAENFYPLPELRPYSDIDILINKHDMQKTKEILINMGYLPPKKSEKEFNEKYWYSQHFFRKENNILLEIHWNIAQLKRYKINIESIWNDAVPIKIGEIETLMMSLDDLMIYLSIHLSYHYYSKLLWLLDLALIIQKERDSISWEKIIERCKTQRVCNPVYFTLLYLKNLLKVDIPENVLKSLKPNSLTYIAIRSMFNTKTLPKRKFVDNKILRFPLALLLIDRMPEKIAFGMEFLHRIPSMNRLYRKE